MALLSLVKPDPFKAWFFHWLCHAAYAVGSLRPSYYTKYACVGSGIIFPILKAEGIRATFFPATMPAYYRTPPAQSTDHRETGK
uniref:Uncharacterized protein n=1 Tax=Salix viminalis TaxID=40686 RepID=A0A6N2K288_SALVM